MLSKPTLDPLQSKRGWCVRYRVGFEDGAIESEITKRNPDLVAVVDASVGWGAVVALAYDRTIAERIVKLLNADQSQR